MNVGPRRTGNAIREASSFVFTLTDKDSGKTRYGICVNFYRPVERYVPSGNANNGATVSSSINKRARNSALRRESWRKSMEKSSDSAFSRQVSTILFIHLIHTTIPEVRSAHPSQHSFSSKRMCFVVIAMEF